MLSKDNNLSTPRSNSNCLNTSKSVELPFMLSILRTLKDHFDSVNRTHYNNVAPVDELFNLFHQLINCYLQLNLPVKSKQNYIKASTTITNTLKDDISLFLDNHFIKDNCVTMTQNNKEQVHSICSSCFSVLNVSKEASFLLHNGSRNGNGVESFLNCEELSNEDIIEKIKQKIEKKNVDIPSQYNSLPINLCNNNTNVKHNNKVHAQTIFTPIKDIKLRSGHNKQQSHNVNSANANNQKTKKGGKAAKSISINTTETPISNNNTSSYIKERTLSVPCKKEKTKQITNLTQLNNNNNQSSNKINNTKHQQQQLTQNYNTVQNINVNVNNNNNTKHKNSSSKKTSAKELSSNNATTLNMSVDKKNNLNHSFNHSVRSHRHYSVPSQPNTNNNNNNHLRTFSNTSSSLNKQTIPKKEEPTISTTTMVSQPTTNNPNNQPEKTETSINDFSKLNSTFVCTTVKTGNVVQKYTLNTKANQNIPKASRYANSLLSKYKGLIAAYNVGQVPNKK